MTIYPPMYLQEKAYLARQDRQLLGDSVTAGVIGSMDSGALEVTSSGATRGISIAAGSAYVAGNQNADQGIYRFFSDDQIDLILDAASANPRIDQILARVEDSAENSGVGPDVGSIYVAKGVETSGATLANRSGAVADGALPKNVLRLAEVRVSPGMGVVGSGSISDKRNPPYMPRDFLVRGEFLDVRPPDPANNPYLRHSYSLSEDRGYIQAGDDAEYKELALNPNGGPVVIKGVPASGTLRGQVNANGTVAHFDGAVTVEKITAGGILGTYKLHYGPFAFTPVTMVLPGGDATARYFNPTASDIQLVFVDSGGSQVDTPFFFTVSPI